MKKYIITSVLALACAGGAYAQGTVAWGSGAIAGNVYTAQTNSVTYSPLFGGGATSRPDAATGLTGTGLGGFYYELLYTSMVGFQSPAAAPTTVSALAAWSDSGLSATNRASLGQVLPAGQANAKAVPWDNGVTNTIMFVGWSANLGTTWAAALAKLQAPNTIVGDGFFGMSTIGYMTPGTSAVTGNNAFSSSGANVAYGKPINSLLTPLFLIPVPEPGTMALAGLGGLAMLALRRKK